MHPFYRCLGSLLLVAAIAAAVVTSGCAPRTTYGGYYDRDHRDYHAWDDREDHAYRSYLSDTHQKYRQFAKLKRNQQGDYWAWRHNHPDSSN